MQPKFLLLLFALNALGACTQFSKPPFDAKAEEAAIRSVLNAQQIAWNNGDIEAFMQGYWNSDSLQFMSLRGINKGWQATMDGYKKGYPDRAAMGALSFEILKVTPLSEENFVVTGRYRVTRVSSSLEGVFTLIFKKIEGKWVIIYDHTA